MNNGSIHQKVWSLLDQDIGIRKDILRKIINQRALSFYLIKKYNLRASLDAVISAIRRYEKDESKTFEDKDISSLFNESMIKTRSNVTCITLRKSAPLLDWYNKKDIHGHETRVITAEKNTKLILYNSLIDSAIEFFSKKDIISINTELSEISILLDPKAAKTKGVLARIAGEISLSDINIEEIIVSPPEFVLYVKRKDLVNAHQTLFKIGEGQ